MKIYISGQITGLSYEEAHKSFSNAQSFLESVGFDVVVNPMNNGLPHEAPWEQHIVKDIEMLLECKAIYMMGNWIESRGARCEHHIAQETGMFIIHEIDKKETLPFTCLMGDDKYKAWRVYAAIFQITKLRLHQYCKARTTKEFFARLILIHNLYELGLGANVIASFINRSVGAVYHCVKKYKDEFQYNQRFRHMAQAVSKLLNEKIN